MNDFRAGLLAKELGVKDYVTVEGVQDIDAIAEHGDSIIIDSIEDDHGRLVKYEDDLAKLFSILHEPEEYIDLIKSSSCVVTASAQTALEAKVSGAKVIFIHTPDTLYPETLLSEYGIIIVEGSDSEAVTQHLQNNLSIEGKVIHKYDDETILLK